VIPSPYSQCGASLESALKRHGYYCRSRRAGNTTRSRACISCAGGKARCDNRRPECSRCITKGIECHYLAKTPKGSPPRIQHSDDAPTEQRKRAPSLKVASPSIENRQEASNDSEIIIPNNGVIVSDPEFTDIGGECLDWNGPDIDFSDLLNPQANDETVPYPSSRSSSLVRHSKPSVDQTVQVVLQQAPSSPKVSIPTAPTSTFRSFVQRPKMKTGTPRIANLILHTLKSYPLMMMRHNALPPFLHPRVISSVVENDEMEPLTNCLSLVRMISSGFHGSRKLFWKNVQMECERLCEEVR
jgi:hypothetical protein